MMKIEKEEQELVAELLGVGRKVGKVRRYEGADEEEPKWDLSIFSPGLSNHIERPMSHKPILEDVSPAL